MVTAISLYFAVLCSLVRTSITIEDWDHHIVLDSLGKYHLSWTYTKKEIKFKAEVQTKGYVGFGLSYNGAMAGSDIVTGWVHDGNAYFQDRHGVGNQLPIVDKIQDWGLIKGIENETHTVLTFRRILDPCDKNDIAIDDSSTLRLIYAYSDEDPSENRASAIRYHGLNRGAKSAMLLQPKVQPQKIDNSLRYWDILSPNFTLQGEPSKYWCKIFKTPDLKEKHHIVQIDPLLVKGNEQFVHHMLLYECVGAEVDAYDKLVEEDEHSRGYQCRRPNMPDEMWKCEGVYFAWGIGGSGLTLPEHVGLPLESKRYYMLEVHYDNPGGVTGVTDTSGLRLYYTPHLREEDAGTLMIGSAVSPRMFIPPRREEYLVVGHANSACLKPEMPEKGVKVIGVLLHSHLLGRRLKVRHFRYDNYVRKTFELPVLSEDTNYDFNYQEYRLLPKEVQLEPNDTYTVECVYSSIERDFVTFGGENTVDEMCLAFLLYYPRIERFGAVSAPTLGTINQVLQTNLSPHDVMNGVLVSTLKNYDWNSYDLEELKRKPSFKTDMQENRLQTRPHDTICYLGNGTKTASDTFASYPAYYISYENPKNCHGKRFGTGEMAGGYDDETFLQNSGYHPHTWIMKYVSLFTSILNLLFLKVIWL